MTTRILSLIPIALLALFFLGCASEEYAGMTEEITGNYDFEIPAANVKGEETGPALIAMENASFQTLSQTADDAAPQKPAQSPGIDNRRIIYNCTIGLVVDEYAEFETQLPMLVSKYGGFIANSDTDRRYQDRQSGTWVVRIPVVNYSSFLSGISSLGFAESRSENAQDVTEEYVDIEARIKNKRSLEQRVLAMLEERTGKLSDVLEIERELARVREEIERMEGRLRFLKNRTSLATVTITCREQKEYQPSQAPRFGARIRQAWGDSLGSLRVTCENLVIVAIAALPWLVGLAIPLYVIWKLIKRRRKRAATA